MAATRWGILGTANIAQRVFLPALRETDGVAIRVGSRSPDRGRDWAQRQQIPEATGYDELVQADDLDAIYVALPNDEHVEWAARAAATGKAVLCEKPLGRDAGEVTKLVLETGPHALVWEAFVFPFHPQTELITSLIADGTLGELVAVDSEFHFMLTGGVNIRLDAERAGGALNDVGCYPIRLGRLLFGAEPDAGTGLGRIEGGVDVDGSGLLGFGRRRLAWSASFRRDFSTYTRIIGTQAELRTSNPFHPEPTDTLELWRAGSRQRQWSPGPSAAFEYAIRHIQDVLAGAVAPRYRICDDGVAQAAALDLARSTVEWK